MNCWTLKCIVIWWLSTQMGKYILKIITNYTRIMSWLVSWTCSKLTANYFQVFSIFNLVFSTNDFERKFTYWNPTGPVMMVRSLSNRPNKKKKGMESWMNFKWDFFKKNIISLIANSIKFDGNSRRIIWACLTIL